MKKCKNCKLIYSSPQPVPFDIQDHYGVPPESYWRPEYFIPDPAYFSEQIRIQSFDLQDHGTAAIQFGQSAAVHTVHYLREGDLWLSYMQASLQRKTPLQEQRS